MRDVIKRGTAVVTALLLWAPAAFAEERPVFIQFVRPLGMGGAFTAIADDHNALMFNPAGMVQRTAAETTILDLVAGGSSDTREGYKYVQDHKDQLTHFDTLTPTERGQIADDIAKHISQLDPHIRVGADVASFVSGPKFFGLPVHGGFGFFGNSDVRFGLSMSAAQIPFISYDIQNDFVLPLAFAKRFNAPFVPGKIGVGVTGKVIRRMDIKDEFSTLEIDDLKIPPLAMGHGVGSDLGFLYQPTDRTNLGLMVEDFLGTKLHYDAVTAKDGFPAREERDTVIRPRTNLGIALVPQKILWLVPTGDRWTFALDVRDVREQDQHLLFQRGFRQMFGDDMPMHLHFGTEFRYWFLRFRAGAYQGYPSVGLGIDIPFLKLDYAYYGEELGARAGDHRGDNNVISLAFRFGSGGTESRERIANRKKAEKANAVAPDNTGDAGTPSATAPSDQSAVPAAGTPDASMPAPAATTAASTPPVSPAATAAPTDAPTPAPSAAPAASTKTHPKRSAKRKNAAEPTPAPTEQP